MFTRKYDMVLNLFKNLKNCYKINNSFSSNFFLRKNSTQSELENFNLEVEILNMKKIYPSIKEELLKIIPSYLDKLQFEKFTDYNFNVMCRGGLFKNIIYLYRTLSPTSCKSFPTKEEQYTLSILYELWHAPVFIVDDILDKSELRFNYPAWHTFNDEYEVIHYYVPALYSSVSLLIAKNIEKYSYYKNLSALCHKSGYKFSVAPAFDYLSPKLQKNIDWIEFYRRLLYFKGMYFFEIPIKSILYSIGYEKIPNEKEYDEVLAKIGFYFQATNDYLDHFGLSDKTGKNLDDDMKSGIIGWPMVYAWKYGSDKQRKLIAENYGRENKRCMDTISGIYEDLNLREKFIEFDEECRLEIKNSLKVIPDKNMQTLALKAMYMIKKYGTDNFLK